MTVQGTYEWLKERAGHVTASKFKAVLTPPKSKEKKRRGQLSDSAETYMRQLLAEHLTGEPTEEISAKQLEWGIHQEPFAREAYEEKTGLEVVQVGFVKHANEPLIGCSPDGLLYHGRDGALAGAIQIKCPMTQAQHLLVIESGRMPDDHEEQVQGEMFVLNVPWCDFVSYHPAFPQSMRLFVVRVFRCQAAQVSISKAVIAFRNKLLLRLHSIIERFPE